MAMAQPPPAPRSGPPPSAHDATAIAVIAAYHHTAASYDRVYSDPVARAEDRIVRRWLAPAVARLRLYQAVVDLGCGTGLFLRLFPTLRTHQYLGLDISPDMLDQARSLHPRSRFEQRDLRDPLDPDLAATTALLLALYGAACYHPTPLQTLQARLASLPPGASCRAILFGPGYESRIIDAPPTITTWDELDDWRDALPAGWTASYRALSPRALARQLETYGERPGAALFAHAALSVAARVRPRAHDASFILLDIERPR